MSARWICHFNGVSFAKIPKGWYYASNAYMQSYAEDRALEILNENYERVLDENNLWI